MLPSSTTEGTLPRLSTPLIWFPVFSLASVFVKITVLGEACKTGPILDSTIVQAGLDALARDVVVKVTAPGVTADELCKVIGLRGREVRSLPTDLVSAESLASDMTYSVLGGLVVTVGTHHLVWLGTLLPY